MASGDVVSFKIYFENEDAAQNEVRRFGIQRAAVDFLFLTGRLVEVFPKLSGKEFTVYWKDEDNDNVIISSNEDLCIALTEMKSDIKKLYVTMKGSNSESDSDVLHPKIICDGCDLQISGCRYKCMVCPDYDLCRKCERDLHFEHPMLRIASPHMCNLEGFRKFVRTFSPFGSRKFGKHGRHYHERKTHAFDLNSDVSKKKRRCDKSDSETDDVDKHTNGKHTKHHKPFMFKGLVTDVFTYLDPFLLHNNHSKENPSNGSQESASASASAAAAANDDEDEPHHVKYLRNIGNTIVSLLDPLGIDVDVEVRAKDFNKKEKAEQKENCDKQEASSSQSSESPKKGVRFADSEKVKETLIEKVEEITNILAKQMVSESPEREDWVSYEELKRSVNENSKEAESPSPSCPPMHEQTPTTSSGQESQNLYPKLRAQESTSMDPFIRQSLEKMLAMGFTNDGDWLRQLLEAKEGDISQVVEALTPHKKS